MRCSKTVTAKKMEANRKNALRSTGPRTERGKRNTKFNAVTLGLFAKHVVIPVCDGYKADRDFRLLLDGLHQEFQPIGFYEEWLVVKIAECMWRIRRATRCESGSVQESAIWADRRQDDDLILNLAIKICTLTRAEEQLRDSGTLSHKLYEQVVPLVEKEVNSQIRSEKENEPVETNFDRELFLACIVNHKESLKSLYEGQCRIDGRQSDARDDHEALLPEADMDRILRYEERMHRQIDWAVQRLLEHQERRRTSEPG